MRLTLFPLSALNCLKDVDSRFQEAIKALNSLQSNAAVLKEAVQKRLEDAKDPARIRLRTVDLTRKYSARCGINIGDLEQRVIHVAGTKGKGSTCAYCESILRRHGYRTGLFTSPHLVSVTERIRIDGRSLSHDEFTRHFWRVYNSLDNNKDYETDMPTYFKFLTVMAFSVFLSEDVDVAIIEVGVGGQYDCTNVFKFKPVVGISSLGLDHTRILGDTVESIAWQKGGIITPGCVAFTAAGQEPSALAVLNDRAVENKCNLLVAPGYEEYRWPWDNKPKNTDRENKIVPRGVQFINCSLAIQLTNAWINYTGRRQKDSNGNGNIVLDVDDATLAGVRECVWLGRYQQVTVDGINYFIDGAHTPESIHLCAQWFAQHSPPSLNGLDKLEEGTGRNRVLVFNCTGGRQASSLLAPLSTLDFTHVYFTTNQLYDDDTRNSPDTVKVAGTQREDMDKCREHSEVWRTLIEEPVTAGRQELRLFTNVSSALEALGRLQLARSSDVLVTGSLHLVGAVLAIIQPPPD